MYNLEKNMEIRFCDDNDIIEVGKFYDNVVLYLLKTINYPKWEYKIYPSELSVREKVLANQQLMCIDEDSIVGAFVLNTDPQGKYEKTGWTKNLLLGEYMVCHTLAVSPDVQGKGIGKQMVEFCIQYAKDNGYKGIRLDVVPDNLPARSLYEKCGFNYEWHTGERYNGMWKKGKMDGIGKMWEKSGHGYKGVWRNNSCVEILERW